MKTFYTTEAKIIDLITNNLETYRCSPKESGRKRPYVFVVNETAREELREILAGIYTAGREDKRQE